MSDSKPLGTSNDSPRKTAIPLRYGRVIGAGIVVVALLFGGFGTWALTADLASAVLASGIVTVDGKRKQVQHQEGGTVKALLVSDGDRVEMGQPLVLLDETRPQAVYRMTKASHDAALMRQARLAAERDTATDVPVPSELVDVQDAPEVAELIAGQRALFAARRESLNGTIEILTQREAQLDREIVGLAAQETSKARQLELVRDELDGQQQLFSQGLSPKTRVLALEREKARLEGERGELIADIARTEKAIGETRMEVLQRKREFRESVESELRTTQQELFDLRERMVATKDVLDRIVVRAPASGVVVGLDVNTIGGVIAPGETILEIVPDSKELVVEARVSPLDVDSLRIGQPAEVRFTAFRQQTTPLLEGSFVYVSADVMLDERSGQSHYVVRVQVPEEEVRRLGELELVPGMPAEVAIKTGDQRPVDYLVQPIVQSIDRAWREN